MDREQQQQVGAMWGLGDYAQVAARLRPAAAAVATAVTARSGAGTARVALDVAAGTGSLAIALAEAGWSVRAVDISPALVEQGRARTAELALDVDWHEASLDALPLDEASVDLVGSSFGLIFAPDPDQALAELRRVIRPGGLLAFSAWTPTSYLATMTDLISTFMPGGPPSTTFTWGDTDVSVPWVERHFEAVEVVVETLPWHFDSPAAASEFMFTHSPGHVASLTYAGDRASEMRLAVEQQLEALATDGHIRIEAEYVVVSARRG